MPFGLPARDEINWDVKLNDSVNAVKATADAAAVKANNLSDLASATTARTNLGLGDSATKNTGTTTGTVAAGDDSRITGAAQKASNLSDLADAPTARTNLGLGNVNNTSDANKPVSTAQQTALDGKAGLAATKNVFTGKVEYNGGFTNSYDSVIWVAGTNRAAPTINSQGLYIQHRVSGDLGGFVHDASATELRVSGGTNAGAGQNAHEASLVITGGANTIGNMNGVTANFHSENTPSGSVTSLAIYRSQTVPALTGTLTVGTIYGVYVEPQTVGTTENWSVYAPSGTSLFGTLALDGAAGSSSRSLQITTNKVLRWLIRGSSTAESGSNVGSDFEILARTDAGASNFTPLVITRSSGLTQINNGLKVTGNVGFFGGTPAAKPTVTGSKGANAALTSLMSALVGLGLVTDTTT